ncbi:MULTISPECIES: hypothetical protein [unclassified Streptomyces]|uniref:hypothetical protein n=1 Tax=unclassified Streptomyces TaxID=2593676 RepID=UPI00365EADD7
MDPNTVAQLAGSAVVAAMATDAWQQARGGVVALWRRVRPDEAPTVDEELSEAQTVLLADDGRVNAAELTEVWRARLLELLLADQRRTDELAEELDRLTRSLTPPAPRAGPVRMNARATRGGRVYQSGGDMTINER